MQYKHGGDIFEKAIEHDFSININPLGMPKAIADGIISAVSESEIYPDYKCRKLVSLLAKKHEICENQIVMGNGASELILAISRLNFKNAVIIQPTFSEYADCLLKNGVEVFNYVMDEKLEFNIEDAKKIPQCDVCFLCNPNNPTGKFANFEVVKTLAKRMDKFGGVLVLDECFIEFVENAKSGISLFEEFKNIIILRAFTKSYAMAGVRLGYAICGNEKLAEKIKNQLPMWNVSNLAQRAGEIAIRDCCDFKEMLEVVKSGRKYLEFCLMYFGFRVYIGDANFILFDCGFDLKTPLLQKGIMIRDASNFVGLADNMFRICVSTADKNKILIRKIAEVMAERGELCELNQ